MTQAELGLAVGVSRSAINSWERGRSYPRNRIGALEEVLGIRLDEAPPADHRDDLLAQLRVIIGEAGEAGGDTTGRGRT
jgi:transcriptional regulator with XRE-family HTH domain